MSIAPAIESALKKGGVLIVDEIEKELHPMLRVRLLMTSGCIEYWFMLHYKYYTPKLITVPEKEKVINEVKKLIPTYVKGNSAATEKIAVNYQKAVENSKKTVKALLPDGLPGIDDTDIRNQWLNTKSVTFSNVYEAIEFLQNCG